MTPSSVCQEALNQEIEMQNKKEEGLEDDNLIETWFYFYEEASLAAEFPYNEGFRRCL